LKNNGDSDISIMLVGNKNDLESDRAISLEEGKNFAEFHKMAFIETSALNGNNIEKAFSELISDVYKSQNFSSNKKDNIKLNEKTINIENVEQKDEEKEEPLAKKGCCS
jgi:GTPase SAR1 family protein